MAPPFVPSIRSPDDTQYFDEEEPITDFSDSEDEDNDQLLPDLETSTPVAIVGKFTGRDGADDPVTMKSSFDGKLLPTAKKHLVTPPPSIEHNMQEIEAHRAVSSAAATSTKRAGRQAQLAEALEAFHPNIQHAVLSWIAVPYDSLRLRNFELQVDLEPGLRSSERDALKALVRLYGRKEKKRPRDRLLRDPTIRKLVLEERKKTAFLGYDWKRIQTPTLCPAPSQMQFPVHGAHDAGFGARPGLPHSATTGSGLFISGSNESKSDALGASGAWAYPVSAPHHGHEDLAAMRALHRAPLSMN